MILYGVWSGDVGAETVVQCLVMRRTLDPVAAWTLSFGCAIALFPNYIMLATLAFYHNVSSQVWGKGAGCLASNSILIRGQFQ